MREAAVLAFLVLVAAAVGASAKEGAALEDAKALAQKGERIKAAERFGDAVAAAQAAGDLQAEQTAADAAESFFGALPEDPATDAPAPRPPTRSAVLAAMMRKLDAARAGACVSAPVLARNVLQLATESGDFSAIGDAAKVAGRSRLGGAAPVVAKYATGLRAVADGRLDEAIVALEAVVTDAGKARWFELTMHASAELAALHVRQNAPDKAAAAIAGAVAQIDDTCGTTLPALWQAMTKRRCAGAPETLWKPIDDLIEHLKTSSAGGNSASAAGGAGGTGSRISRLLPTWPKGKPFVSVTRRATGLEIHWATKPDAKPSIAFPGTASQATEGGVKIGFFGRSVALIDVDLVHDAGMAIGGGLPSPVRAFYLLAEGETWGVSKEGVVTISR